MKPELLNITKFDHPTITAIAAERPLRLWEIVQANLDFTNSNGLQKAARELEKQGNVVVTRDKDGNIYRLALKVHN